MKYQQNQNPSIDALIFNDRVEFLSHVGLYYVSDIHFCEFICFPVLFLY
jgi:hypothetical protein